MSRLFFLAPLDRGKIISTNAVCFFKVKRYGKKAVILAESGGVSADVFSPEITFHSLGGQLSAIVNSVNHAGGDIQLFILPQLGLDADEDGLGGCANLGANQIAVTVKKAEQVTLLFGFIQQPDCSIGENFLAVVVPDGIECRLRSLAVGGHRMKSAELGIG